MDLVSKTTVFEARTHGYHIYRIPCLAATERGTLIASVEARRGVGGDWDTSDIVFRRSLDLGKSWEEIRTLAAQPNHVAGPMNNCVMIVDQQEALLHVLYCQHYGRVFYTFSCDEGITFIQPRDITEVFENVHATYPWRVVATGPGHGIQLSSGRLIVPVWMSEGSGTEFGLGKLGHRPSMVTTIFSDDHGESWQTGEIVVRDGDRSIDGREIANPSEAVAVEIMNGIEMQQAATPQFREGSVCLNIRSESEVLRRLVATSPDGASGWSLPWFDDALLEPICMASLVAAKDPERLIFANPDTLEITMGQQWNARDRKRLTAQVSYDQGTTWKEKMVIEEGPAGYSDMVVLPGGEIGILYECGIIEHMADTRSIVFARFS
jgi:sialidase-1